MKQESSLDKIVSSIALLCVGVCFVVWADKVTEWIAILFGVFALIFAIVKIVQFFRTDPEKRTTLQLFYVILSAAAGVLLVSRANFIKEAISFVVGVYIILTCAVQSLNIASLRRHTGLMVGSYVWPVIGIIVGSFCVGGQFIIPDELARLTGAVLIIYAIVYLTGFAVVRSAVKQASIKPSRAKIEEAVIVKEARETEVEDSAAKPKQKTKK